MKRVLFILIAVVFVGTSFIIPVGNVKAAGTFTAFEASKIVFNRDFSTGNHLMDSRLKASHSSANEFKLAVDTAFLSVYTSQAKSKNDPTYSTALAELNKSIGYLYSKVTANEAQFANAYNAPGTGFILQTSILIKKFNMSDLSITRQNQVNYLYDKSKLWLNNAYNSTSGNGKTFRYNVENQVTSGSGESTLAPFAVNILAIHGGALALDSDLLFKKYGVNNPTDYPNRNMIANIGNFVKNVNFGNYGTQGRLGNVGGARNYVDPGYLSWHGLGLAQMAHGTVYTQKFSQRPSSVLMTEAEAITTGFKGVYNSRASIPNEFRGFGGTILASTDVREWLYSLAWSGDQLAINWLDSINEMKYGASTSEPIISKVAKSDVDDGNSSEANFHRAVSGLTAGMLKELTFK